MCPVCNKRIGTRYAVRETVQRGMATLTRAWARVRWCGHVSAFAFYPNGVIVHYMCSKDPKVSPV